MRDSARARGKGDGGSGGPLVNERETAPNGIDLTLTEVLIAFSKQRGTKEPNHHNQDDDNSDSLGHICHLTLKA